MFMFMICSKQNLVINHPSHDIEWDILIKISLELPSEGASRNKIELFISVKSLYICNLVRCHYDFIFLHSRRRLSMRVSYIQLPDLVYQWLLDSFLIKNIKIMMGANQNKRSLHNISSTSMFHYTHFMYQRYLDFTQRDKQAINDLQWTTLHNPGQP